MHTVNKLLKNNNCKSNFTINRTEMLNDKLNPGIYAIIPLNEENHASNQLKYNGNIGKPFDIILFYWPIYDAFDKIDRNSQTTVFIRVLHELCSTVCVLTNANEV